MIVLKIALFSIIFKNRSLQEAMKLSKEIGFDGIELWGMEPHISPDITLEKAKEIRKMLSYYELRLSNIGSYIGKFSTSSEIECEKNYKNLEKYLNIMKVLECDLIRVNCGGPNAFRAQEKHYDKALRYMEKCSNLVSKYDMRIAMEIHNGSLIETVEAADKFIKQLNKENVGLIHDAGNMYITDTDYGVRSVEVLKNKIFHVHIKDELRVKEDSLPGAFHSRTIHGDETFQQKMLGEGAVNHIPLFKALMKIGYKGFLSCECHAEVPDIVRARHDFEEIKRQLRVAESELKNDIC